MTSPILRSRWCLLLLATLMLSCGEARKILIGKKLARMESIYVALSACERVAFVQDYLIRGSDYDPVLETYFPTDDRMGYWLFGLSRTTGISYATVSTLPNHGHRPFMNREENWLDLIELWNQKLGCTDRKMDREAQLKWCDPFLAEVYDSVVSNPLVWKSFGRVGAERIRTLNTLLHADYACCLTTGLLENVEEVGETYRVGSFDAISPCPTGCPDKSYRYGAPFYRGRRSCLGLLPNDSLPDCHLYFGWASDSTMVVMVFPPRHVENYWPYYSDLPYFEEPVGLVFQRKRDGSRALFAAGPAKWYQYKADPGSRR